MFKPRQVANKTGPSTTRNVVPPPTASASLGASSGTSHAPLSLDDDRPPPPAPIASTSTAAPPTVAPRPDPKLSTKEKDRLQTLLATIESSFSDWGLSTYQRQNGMLQRLKQDPNQNVHLQYVVRLDPIIALTNNQADLQKALRHKTSSVVEVRPSGHLHCFLGKHESEPFSNVYQLDPNDPFQLHVKRTLHYDRLEHLTPSHWDPCILYLEHVPSPTHHSLPLVELLAQLLRTTIQRIILPPGYDPSNPPSSDALHTPSSDRPTQSELFDQSRSVAKDKDHEKGKGKGLRLPKSGGTFKGFVFVIVEDVEDAQRVLSEWDWDWDAQGDKVEQDEAEALEKELESEIEREMGMEVEVKVEDQERAGEEQVDLVKVAKKGGMRAITYLRWLEFQAEYLIYQQALEGLKKEGYRSSSKSYYNGYDDREPIPSKDLPPHLRIPSSSSASSSNLNSKTKRPSTNELASSTPHKKPRTSDLPPPAPAPRAGKPLPALDSRAALKLHGAYPLDCVLWVRNLHENSTKGALRTLFSKLLDRLEEGSGKGCEFVDYEKGLESAKVRFSTPHHAQLVRTHFEQNPTRHTRRDYFSFEKEPMTPPEGMEEQDLHGGGVGPLGEGRRLVVAELLKGDLEREYWDKIPEEKRRDARKSAKVEVGIVGKKNVAPTGDGVTQGQGQGPSEGEEKAREAVGNGDRNEEPGQEGSERNDEESKEEGKEKAKKRKRPSARI
ncbi:BZ3500_MvSof-1268-A1-R1_Chr3-3g06477 [Microbotryum saponariae]|uniref:BZ3500_MvSof-1268-A1-R1_Chr3-3g06477 protein n=1 Tax=Microbotryum saponariae TaxID=289078 RepID=A0A2X0KUU3_9BASI|nr:BZ3500_MvSof-1268-A1-R1_Chr3-3g06477 [Microbotryum saponariae]SDA04444.1 BZ3501_MvSof-1269-A2-R1_Chr3-2g06164 [Microbotryum saponariae]